MPRSHEKTWFSMSQAARAIGVSAATLCRAAKLHPLYAPAIRGLAGLGSFGHDICRYHAEQIRLLQAALAGNLAVDEATMRWQIAKRKIGTAN